MSVVTLVTRRQKLEGSVTSVSCDGDAAGRNWRAVSLVSVVTSRRRRRQKLEGSVTSVSCDLSVTPPAETGGQCH